MKKYNKVQIETEEIGQVSCNCCGKECCYNDKIKSDYMEVEQEWGFFSKKDGEIHKWDICEECYDKFVNDFKISPFVISQY